MLDLVEMQRLLSEIADHVKAGTRGDKRRAADKLKQLASIATTMVEEPNTRLASRTRSGLATAAVFSATLSAPARNTARMSSIDRRPPPTVSGMKVSRAVAWMNA